MIEQKGKISNFCTQMVDFCRPGHILWWYTCAMALHSLLIEIKLGLHLKTMHKISFNVTMRLANTVKI